MKDYKSKYMKMKKLYLEEQEKMYAEFVQIGGVIYTDPKSNKRYSGSGLMMFELYNGKPSVILFKSIRSSKYVYEDLGGVIDEHDLSTHDPLKSAAIREAFEESRGLINIMSPKHIDEYIDHGHNSTFYRSYLIGVNLGQFLNDDYSHNKKITDDHERVSNPMKETIDIDRFYISDLVMDGILDSKGSFVTKDTNGRKRTIFKRAADILKDSINADIIKKIINNPIEFIQLKSLVSV